MKLTFFILFHILLLISLSHQKYLHSEITYPNGPQGPDFATQPGSLKLDLLERNIDTFWNVESHPAGFYNQELQEYRSDAVSQLELPKHR